MKSIELFELIDIEQPKVIEMTVIRDIEMKCSVCDNTSRQPILSSTNAWGTPDLDLRPPEMQRSTMITWVLECPHCGYVAGDLSDESEISEEFLKTEKYLTCDGIEFERDLSERFYRGYLISEETDNLEGCFLNLHHCAWTCDDAEDLENAKKIRKLAIAVISKLIQQDDEENHNLLLRKADLLRRSGEFDQVIEEYKDRIFGDELLDKIVTFQILKAREGDDACYTVEDVTNELND